MVKAKPFEVQMQHGTLSTTIVNTEKISKRIVRIFFSI